MDNGKRLKSQTIRGFRRHLLSHQGSSDARCRVKNFIKKLKENLLAEQVSADILLLDEKQARLVASALGLRVTGMLGVLDEVAGK